MDSRFREIVNGTKACVAGVRKRLKRDGIRDEMPCLFPSDCYRKLGVYQDDNSTNHETLGSRVCCNPAKEDILHRENRQHPEIFES